MSGNNTGNEYYVIHVSGLINNHTRQHQQNSKCYDFTINVLNLQLPHVSTLFGSSSGCMFQFYFYKTWLFVNKLS